METNCLGSADDHVIRDKNGQFNIFSGSAMAGANREETKEKIQKALPSLFGCSFVVRAGEIFFSDESLGSSPLKTEIRSFNFKLSSVSYHKALPFRISGNILHSEKDGQFSIGGTVRDIPEDMDFSRAGVEAEVKLKGIETLHFWPYLKTMLPMKMISGILDLNAHYRGDFRGPFKTSAKITMRDVLFDYPQVFSFILKPKWLNLTFEAEYDAKDFKIPRFFIELPEIWIKAKGRIYDIGSKEMGMEAEASSSSFDIAEGKKFIPFRIITPDVSDRLFRSEGKGSFQAVSVKLSGKMPEIDHCDELVNAHVLSVEAILNRARLKLPWDFPPLENLSGRLLFQKGDLHFNGLEGKILHSTLEKVNGTFYELLHVPTLQIACQGKFDLTDLPAFTKIEGIPEEFSRTLSSVHIDSGKAEYSLSAKGLLKPPLRFQQQGTYRLSKTLFTHPHIPFPIRIEDGRIELSSSDLQWSDAQVEFGNSSLTMTGLWKHGERKINPSRSRPREESTSKISSPSFKPPYFPKKSNRKQKTSKRFRDQAKSCSRGRPSQEFPASLTRGRFSREKLHSCKREILSLLFLRREGFPFPTWGWVFQRRRSSRVVLL